MAVPHELIQSGNLAVFSDPAVLLCMLADPGPWWWTGARICCESLVVRLALGLQGRRLVLMQAMERWAMARWAMARQPLSIEVQRALVRLLYCPAELLAGSVGVVVRGALEGASDAASVRRLVRLARELAARGAVGGAQVMAALAALEQMPA